MVSWPKHGSFVLHKVLLPYKNDCHFHYCMCCFLSSIRIQGFCTEEKSVEFGKLRVFCIIFRNWPLRKKSFCVLASWMWVALTLCSSNDHEWLFGCFFKKSQSVQRNPFFISEFGQIQLPLAKRGPFCSNWKGSSIRKAEHSVFRNVVYSKGTWLTQQSTSSSCLSIFAC